MSSQPRPPQQTSNSNGATRTETRVRQGAPSRLKRPDLSEVSRERQHLDSALVQDFLDDLPDPVGVTELAAVLAIPRAVVHGRLRRGALAGEKTPNGWNIDVEMNRDWIAAQWKSSIRRRDWSEAVRADRMHLVVDDPRALTILRALTSSPMAPAEAIVAALIAFHGSDGSSLARHEGAEPAS